ncbi:MAG TPA: PDZ domain-containing protein [Pyrinomonadaceae bacterium]|nr:PDZ domain-containing protein [Pyrinomonadaceae bacterium]
MKLRALPGLAALALLSASAVVRSQQAAPPAPASPSTPPAAAQAPAMPAPAALATAFFDDGPFLGVQVEDVTRANMNDYGLTGEPRGVGVRSVFKGSPAERAGVRERDVIVRFDGDEVGSVRKLTRLIEESAPDHPARLTVLRGGSEQQMTATLAHRDVATPDAGGVLSGGFDLADAQRFGEEWAKNSEQLKRQSEELNRKLGELQREHPGVMAFGAARRIGVTTSPLGRQLADYFGVSHGVLVNSVEANSPAAKAGLKAGDVITEAGGQQVEDASDLVRALDDKDEEVTLTVVREHKQRNLRVKPERWSQGLLINPDAFRVEAPIASTMIPRIAVPPALAAPRVYVLPRVAPMPYVAPTPRLRVLGSGEKIL